MMRLLSYESADSWRPGILLDGSVFDVDDLLRLSTSNDEDPVGSIRELLRRYGESLVSLGRRLAETAQSNSSTRVGSLGEVRIGPPIPDPAKVLCIGLNYNDHVAETGRALPSHPDVFAKFASTLIGPCDDIRCSRISGNLDYEGELAVVIGRECRDIDAEDALQAVAGLMVLNDITARDLQYRGTQWLPGKAIDASTPCGPALVTLDEVGDPQNLELQTRVNGVQVQSCNTRYMIFPVRELVAYVSTFLTLSPGDIISTGTPKGIGSKRQPPSWLKPGDAVEVEIQHVGVLRNFVR